LNTKEKIIKCAIEIFLEDGYKNLSMRKIADCSGLSATAIYRHYKDKNELIQEIVHLGFDKLFFTLTNRFSFIKNNKSNTKKNLIQCLDDYKTFCLDNSSYYRVMFLVEDEIDFRETKAYNTGVSRKSFQFLHDITSQYLQSIDSKLDPSFASLTLWSHIHGILSLYILKRIQVEDLHTFYKKSTSLLLRGLE